MTTYLTLRPVDVLALRGNRLFSDGYGECLMPPWPSALAGAIRTRILADRGISFADVRAGKISDPAVAQALGTYEEPGSFRVSFVGLHHVKGEALWVPMPADLVAFERDGKIRVSALEPSPVDGLGIGGSFDLPWVPVLRQGAREKTITGLWLSLSDLTRHLEGSVSTLAPRRGSEFWAGDPRLGIALDGHRRTVREGMLYTTDTIAFNQHAGLAVGVEGADAVMPREGLLRLGGDGHAVEARVVDGRGSPGPGSVGKRFRMVLATPGSFDGGWLPPGVSREGEHQVLRADGFAARLLAAAVPRHEVISGWDLVRQRPKPAERVVATGAVYWFEQVEGDDQARAAWTSRLRKEGLWALEGSLSEEKKRRQSEGFNNVWLGNWAHPAS